MTIASAAVLLFLVMDPLGNVPVFVTALRHVAVSRQRKVILRELCIALGALLAFLFLGRPMLRVMGLSQPALGVGGGVVLLLIALRMIFPPHESAPADVAQGEPFVVPLAIPCIAGPSSLATVLLMMSREPARWLEWVAAVLIAWAACVPIMLASGDLRKLLGERGLTAVERLMGLVLVTVAVQMLMTGVAEFLAAHKA